MSAPTECSSCIAFARMDFSRYVDGSGKPNISTLDLYLLYVEWCKRYSIRPMSNKNAMMDWKKVLKIETYRKNVGEKGDCRDKKIMMIRSMDMGAIPIDVMWRGELGKVYRIAKTCKHDLCEICIDVVYS